MSEDLILEELRAMRERMDELLRLVSPPPSERPDDLLACEEAAHLLRVAPDTLRRGKAGTASIPRHSDRPVMFRRAEVERFLRERGRKGERREKSQRISLVRRKRKAA
jgi:hypothetical protein